ncbi:MAG: hypothetical protein GY926_18575 [bacterium]|nr:hypothetical protein [bacterium]
MSISGDVELLRGVLDSSDGEWDWNGPLPGALGRLLDEIDRLSDNEPEAGPSDG